MGPGRMSTLFPAAPSLTRRFARSGDGDPLLPPQEAVPPVERADGAVRASGARLHGTAAERAAPHEAALGGRAGRQVRTEGKEGKGEARRRVSELHRMVLLTGYQISQQQATSICKSGLNFNILFLSKDV